MSDIHLFEGFRKVAGSDRRDVNAYTNQELRDAVERLGVPETEHAVLDAVRHYVQSQDADFRVFVAEVRDLIYDRRTKLTRAQKAEVFKTLCQQAGRVYHAHHNQKGL